MRILAYLHVSHAGIYGFSNTVMVGESEDIRLMDPVTAAEVADANRDVIVGIKVRVGRHASGDQGVAPLDIALQVAEETGLPLMAHIDEPPPSYEEVIARLRPGDVLTHAFRPFPNSPATAQGTVKPAVLAARKRGVLFDIGHGMGSFAFKTARAMLANGFAPDTISSDVHALCINGPAFDQVTTMSKFLCLGMSLPEVIKASTGNCRLRAEAAGTRQPEARKRGRCDDPLASMTGTLRLCRRGGRAPRGPPAHHLARRGHQRQVVASGRDRFDRGQETRPGLVHHDAPLTEVHHAPDQSHSSSSSWPCSPVRRHWPRRAIPPAARPSRSSNARAAMTCPRAAPSRRCHLRFQSIAIYRTKPDIWSRIIAPSPHAAMPDMTWTLTADEVQDVLAYILSLDVAVNAAGVNQPFTIASISA